MKVSEIAALTGGEVVGDADRQISRPASFASAVATELAFLEKSENFSETLAGCIIAPTDFDVATSASVVKVEAPKLAFAKASAVLLRSAHPGARVSPRAVVDPTAVVEGVYVDDFATVGARTHVGRDAVVSPGTRVGADCRIGEGTVIHPNVVIYDNVEIGARCVIHAGAVIGADGFGFVRDGAEGYVKFPQIGVVRIGNDVEIGAGTCVDRGALGETVIGDGTKIDNLVQIAHNVRIGKRVVIASQTGISGSTVIEDDCVIGGQVGFGDHATVRSGAVIGSQAGVLPGKIVRPGVWWGTPVQPLDEYKRQNAHIKGLERLKSEVRDLKKKLDELLAGR